MASTSAYLLAGPLLGPHDWSTGKSFRNIGIKKRFRGSFLLKMHAFRKALFASLVELVVLMLVCQDGKLDVENSEWKGQFRWTTVDLGSDVARRTPGSRWRGLA